MENFDLSFSRKNIVWAAIGLVAAFLAGGFVISLFAMGLLLFASGFYFVFKKIDNNLAFLGLMVLFFYLISVFIHGWYMPACILISFMALLISFGAISLFIEDLVMSLGLIMVLMLGISFLPSNLYGYATNAWLAVVALVSFLKLGKFKKNIHAFYDYIQNSLSWFDLLTLLLLLLSAILLGVCKCGHFWALDGHHPIYELSIGQSYKNALFNVPDLSYSGKIIKFHFLSTQIPFYFNQIFDISLLGALYTMTMTFFVFLSFLLILSFFKYYQIFRTPLFFIFFLPSFIFSSFECAYRSTVILTASYFLAFIFMICALHFLIRQKYWYLFFCAALLLLIKASFFMSLCGGIFIFWLRQKDSFLKLLIKIIPYALFFLLACYLFLSGAHMHNLWVLMPSSMIHYTKASYFFCRAEAILGALFFVLALYFLIKEKMLAIQALAAIILSGLVGWFLVVELTEGSSYQFIRAIYFPLNIFIWLLINKKISDNVLTQCINNIKECLYKLVFVFFTVFSFAVLACFLFQPFSLAIDVVRANKFSYTKPLIQTYSWLNKNIPQNSVVLFGLHYDLSESFIRSALSGKQLVCEGFKAKGILMEKDYVSRKADIIRFYKYFVNSSDLSKNILNLFELAECGDTPGIPLSQSPAFSVRMLHYLSLGKEWHFINRSKYVKFELKQALKEDFTQENALNFIKQTKITHIVLENGDLPSDFLKKISEEIYNDGVGTVLRIVC